MKDSEFIKSIHIANDAGFIISTERRHSNQQDKRAGVAGDIYEIVIRRGLEVFWIGNSFDRFELQTLAAEKIVEYVRDYGTPQTLPSVK